MKCKVRVTYSIKSSKCRNILTPIETTTVDISNLKWYRVC